MTTVSQMRVFYPYGHEFWDPWPKCVSIYGPGHEMVLGNKARPISAQLALIIFVPLHQSVEKLCLKKRNRVISVFLSPRLDLFPGDLTAVESGQS